MAEVPLVTVEQLEEMIRSGKTFVVKFDSNFCGICADIEPTVERLGEKFAPQGIAIVRVSIDWFPPLPKELSDRIPPPPTDNMGDKAKAEAEARRLEMREQANREWQQKPENQARLAKLLRIKDEYHIEFGSTFLMFQGGKQIGRVDPSQLESVTPHAERILSDFINTHIANAKKQEQQDKRLASAR